MSEPRQVDIRCPQCDSLIVTAPENEMPMGDLVCPHCSAVVEAPTAFDRMIAKVKTTVKQAIDGTADKPEKK